MLAGFVASQLISAGFLAIPVVKLLAVGIGILVAVFGANLIWPSKAYTVLDFVSRLGQRFKTERFYLCFCFACFFIALMIGLLITQSGSGISPDSRRDILAATNLYQGNGFGGYIHYPLYPLLIAGFMHLGFYGEPAASLINVLCFALLMFPVFFLGKTISGVFTGYVACLMCLVFTPLLYVASWIWLEMPYIFLSALAILFVAKFAEGNEAKTKILCVSAFFTGLTILNCYVGSALLPGAVIAIVVKNKYRFKKAISQILLFGSISCLPVILWLCRNFVVTSKLSMGSLREAGYLTALHDAVEWLLVVIPNSIFVRPLMELRSVSGLDLSYYVCPAIVVVCFILIAIYVTDNSRRRKVLLRYLETNYVVISYIFFFLLALIIMETVMAGGFESRYLSPLYPFIILSVISFIFYGYKQVRRPSLKPTLFSAITIFCVLLFAFQAINSVAFYHTAKDGQGWNSAVFRNSQAISWVESNVPDDATLYSDRAYVVGWRTGRPTHFLPYSVNYKGNEEAIDEWFRKLRPDSLRLLSFSSLFHYNETSTTSKTYTDFPNDSTNYYWRVRACNAAGWGTWSDPQSFVNGTPPTKPPPAKPPPSPTLLSPINNEVVSTSTVTFQWEAVTGASKYQVQVSEKKDVFIIRFKEEHGGSGRYISNSKITEMNQRYDVLVVLADFPEATIWGVRR